MPQARLRVVLPWVLDLAAIAHAREDERKLNFASGALLVAAAFLASLAWSGHAAAGKGSGGYVQLCSDAVHLLAAGAWVGALPGLAALLSRAQSSESAHCATRRFSTLGIASVSALLVTGTINAWYLVGDLPSLFGTGYGRLLLAKLALVVAMIAFAVVNRVHLTPRLAMREPEARRSLRRNALLELTLGFGVIAIVAGLGVTIPAAHQSPVWPFAHTLSWQPAEASPSIRAALIGSAVLGGIGAVIALAGGWHRRVRTGVAGSIFVATAAGAATWLLAVPAHPTTYSLSPVQYGVDAIADGAALYGERCAACHGAHGEGDGHMAARLPIRPANLAEHAAHHRSGDLHWWIAHGIQGTPMPAFAPQLGDGEIWKLVLFLHAQADAHEARELTASVESRRTFVAPDFSFEVAAEPQQSLKSSRGKLSTLVVLYTLPESLPRLRALASASPSFAAEGAQVIAIPYAEAPARILNDGAMFAATSPNVGRVYAMFAVEPGSGQPAAHAELLIDRWGYVRARWLGPTAESDRTAEILSQIERLAREPPRAPEQRHVH